mgnify:CR=1 FL=1
MAVINTRRMNPIFWIPPNTTTTYKLTVTRKDGTVDDITSLVRNFKINNGVTDGIGDFEAEVFNSGGEYSNKWTGMEVFMYYADYDSTATTLRFRGRIEKPSYKDYTIKISGRSESFFIMEKNVNKSYSSVDTAAILLDLVNAYGDGRYGVDLIPASSGKTISIKWVDRPFWDAVQDLCNASGYDCYVDENLKFRYFLGGSVINRGEGAVHDLNIVETGEYLNDTTTIKNKVRVYGATIDGVQVMYTVNDESSQADYEVREQKINDDSITTKEEAKELGDLNLSSLTANPQIGTVRVVMLASVQPGEKIFMSDPDNNLVPNYYKISGFTHTYDETSFFTDLEINQSQKTVSNLFKDNISNILRNTDTSANPFDMDFSYIETFDVDSGTHSSTQIAGGALKSTGASGTWLSGSIDSFDDRYLNYASLVIKGSDLSNVAVSISADGGTNYFTLSSSSKTQITSNYATSFIVKVVISSSTASVDSLSIQYTTTTI